jgi:hypothetical protein
MKSDYWLRLVCLSVCLAVRLSVGPHATTRLQQDGFSWNAIRRMRFPCWMTKATNRQSEHVILIAFPRQQWLRERASIRHYMHIACLVTYKDRYCFYVGCFCMLCTALRHTCHGNGFILCTETGIAQALQLLDYALCNRVPRVWFRLCKRFLHNV